MLYLRFFCSLAFFVTLQGTCPVLVGMTEVVTVQVAGPQLLSSGLCSDVEGEANHRCTGQMCLAHVTGVSSTPLGGTFQRSLDSEGRPLEQELAF